ncbi:hypothetical protein HanPSC8_Chr15g0674031 [Helianthus annuus]|nr:hypothetical protein HanPSC8_Chr15g0674031 [Helianthus annuus]
MDFRSTVNYGGTVIYGGNLSFVFCSSFAPHLNPFNSKASKAVLFLHLSR